MTVTVPMNRVQTLTESKDEQGRTVFFDEKGQQYCGAKTRSGGQCMRYPARGRNRCKLHGGATLRGINHPSAKKLLYSKALQGTPLLDLYQQAITDNNILSLEQEIGVLTARLSEILSRDDDKDAGKLWERLEAEYNSLDVAIRNQDSQGVITRMGKLRQLITQGNLDRYKWSEVYSIMESLRRLTHSERDHKVKQHQMIAIEDLLTEISFIASKINEVVSDPKEKVKIIDAIQQRLNPGSGSS